MIILIKVRKYVWIENNSFTCDEDLGSGNFV